MPKVFYVCSECGKRFDNEADACACEKKHEEENLRKKKLAADKTRRADAIKEHYKSVMQEIEEYNKDYNEPAEIPFITTWSKLFDSLF